MREGKEGELYSVRFKFARLDWPDNHPQNWNVRLLFLLPGEKVRLRASVEGERKHKLHPPRLNFYHFNACKRRAASSALARLLKALMRK